MSRPRPVYPGATNFSTRSVHKHEFLLRPDDAINQLIEYTTAVLCERFGIQLHALVVESSHKHDVATDPDGNIVDFQRELHSLVARQVNHLFGESGGLWEREEANRVECQDAKTVLDKIVYTMTNPVKDLLVAHGKSWPGVRRCWPAKDKVIERPKGFFRDEDAGGTWPKTATLRFTRPPGFDDLTDEALAKIIGDAIDAKEAEYRDKARREKRCFLGRRACLEASRHSYPITARKPFGIKPQVAGTPEARIEALARRKIFRQEHGEARHSFFAGDRDVSFPYGTWKMRRYYGARCRPPPA